MLQLVPLALRSALINLIRHCFHYDRATNAYLTKAAVQLTLRNALNAFAFNAIKEPSISATNAINVNNEKNRVVAYCACEHVMPERKMKLNLQFLINISKFFCDIPSYLYEDNIEDNVEDNLEMLLFTKQILKQKTI